MKINIEKEEDGRWIAEVFDLPGVLAYGKTREESIAKVEALALRVNADRIDHGETIPELDELFAVEAGKLDKLAAKALAQHKRGESREL